MRILVTGATGFVGTALCAALRKRGIAFAAAARTAESGAAPHIVAVGSVDGATDWTAALISCDVVVHLAGQAHRAAGKDTAALHATNVEGTINLARQAATAGVQRFVFLSSIKAWGEVTLPGQAARESDTCHPQDAYGHSKQEAELALRQLAQDSSMEFVIIRPPMVYGPGAKANFARLVRAVVRGWPLPFGALRNARSFVGLDNLVDFILLCAQHPAAANGLFHVSDGVDLSTAELVSGIARAAKRRARLLPVPMGLLRLGARLTGKMDAAQRLTGNLQLDISKAKNQLGWVPPLSVEEGLRNAVVGVE